MIKPVFVRNPYNYDTDEVSTQTGLACEDPSLAQQHQKEEADINTIVRRFGLSGQLPTNVRMPSYGDFTNVGTYQEALNAVMAANASFMAMPAYVRERFQNNPELFVEFCSDPNNMAEAVKLGLAIQTTVEAVPAPPAPVQTETPKA